MADNFASSLNIRIENAYQVSNNTLGWRFLASPCKVLSKANVAFIGLNPGGRELPKEHAQFCMDSGSAYLHESWAGFPAGKSPLQQQVLSLFQKLNVEPENVLAGNLVPFRSPDWKSLENKRYSIEFGQKIWSEVLTAVNPRLVVTMGKEVFSSVSNLLGIQSDLVQYHDVSWQGRTIASATNGRVQLVGLPHLSTYKIINRGKSKQALASAFGSYWKN